MNEIKVSAADAPLLLRHNWRIDSIGYPTACVDGKKIRLHRLVMGARAGVLVDHVNRDKLDCRRENLRITDRHGNARNSSMRSHNTSGFRGVHLCKTTGRWRAEIRVNGRGMKLGRFNEREDAARAYDVAATRYHGAFAVLNFTAADDPGAVGKGCDA